MPYHLSSFWLGYLVAGASLGAAAGAVLAFLTADRLGRKTLLIADALIYAVGSILAAVTPNAAILLADFILSREGQEIIKARNRVPVSTAVDSPLNKFRYELIDPRIALDEWDKWSRLWSALFLGGKAPGKGE